MNLHFKLMLLFLLIATHNDIGLTRPAWIPKKMLELLILEYNEVQNNEPQILKRQVVQPKWLTPGSNTKQIAIDPNVHVNAQNIKEAAQIRKLIQDAVDSETYAIHLNDEAAPLPPGDHDDPTSMWHFEWPANFQFQWPTNFQFQWPNFPSFWPTTQASNEETATPTPTTPTPTPTPTAPPMETIELTNEEQKEFWNSMRILWTEFITTSLEWFTGWI